LTVTALRNQLLLPAVPVRVGVVWGTVPVRLTSSVVTCLSHTPKPLHTVRASLCTPGVAAVMVGVGPVASGVPPSSSRSHDQETMRPSQSP
jgi:hypothetical protein